MLYVSSEETEFSEYTWHVEEVFPIPAGSVTMLQADGDEAELIYDLFGASIPFSTRPVQRWYGDTAKAIAYAL